MLEMTTHPLKILYIGWANHVHFIRWVKAFLNIGHRAWVLPTSPGKIVGSTTLPFITTNKRVNFQEIELKFYDALFRFDLVHVHWAGFAYLPLIAGLKPYVVTAWGSDIYKISDYTIEIQEQIVRALRNAALVTVDSEDLKREITNLGVSRTRIKVVQWGVDTKIFRPCSKDDFLLHELGVEGRRIIYSPRNLAPIYNNDVILKAIKVLLNRFPDVLLVQKHYNCSHEKISEYLATATKIGVHNNVKLIGNMPYEQLPIVYSLADAVISVPSSDGTPMSILEGMACGVVPVVSDLPSLREWIQNGINGFLVPIGDHIQLADRLSQLLDDPEFSNIVKKRNLDLIQKRADHNVNMIQMENLYQEVVKWDGFS